MKKYYFYFFAILFLSISCNKKFELLDKQNEEPVTINVKSGICFPSFYSMNIAKEKDVYIATSLDNPFLSESLPKEKWQSKLNNKQIKALNKLYNTKAETSNCWGTAEVIYFSRGKYHKGIWLCDNIFDKIYLDIFKEDYAKLKRAEEKIEQAKVESLYGRWALDSIQESPSLKLHFIKVDLHHEADIEIFDKSFINKNCKALKGILLEKNYKLFFDTNSMNLFISIREAEIYRSGLNLFTYKIDSLSSNKLVIYED